MTMLLINRGNSFNLDCRDMQGSDSLWQGFALKGAKSNGVRYYTAGDDSKKMLVLLHPAFATHNYFDGQVQALRKDFFLVALDIRNHGASPQYKEGFSYHEVASDIMEIAKLHNKRTFSIVGVSMGGEIAQVLALDYPEAVSSLVLVGCALITEDSSLGLSMLKRFSTLAPRFVPLARLQNTLAKTTSDDLAIQEQFFCWLQGHNKQSIQQVASASRGIFQEELKGKLDCPILFMHGENEIALAVKEIKKGFEASKNAQYIVIPKAKHVVNMENAERFNQELLKFFRKTPSTHSVIQNIVLYNGI